MKTGCLIVFSQPDLGRFEKFSAELSRSSMFRTSKEFQQ
jgi:hypothetical protein